MQLINLKKNTPLFNNCSVLVVGNNVDRLIIYLAEILDVHIDKEILIIDPATARQSNDSYRDFQNSEIKERYDQFEIGALVNKCCYEPSEKGIILILNNCFSKRDDEGLFYDETERLFRKSVRMNMQLIVAIKHLIIPHEYYRYFDFILVNEPTRYLRKLSMHFPIEDEIGQQIKQIEERNYLFIDNRKHLQNNSNIYYYWENEEMYNQTNDHTEVTLTDNDVCCICLTNYINGDMMIECHSCNNYGHQLCLLQWYEHNTSCPLCRGNSRHNKVVIFNG